MSNRLAVLFFFLLPTLVQAQFLDEFNKEKIEGWFFFTGDGNSTMDFVPMGESARIQVDATEDHYNVWWAIIKNDVTSYLDISKLKDPKYELRVEVRVKLSHAPRRVNFMINTQRTTDFHEHLREYDIADTSKWHVLSMTTKNLDVVPGDTLYVQFGVTDWGQGSFYADLDYYRADIVNVKKAEPDKGEPLIYHPPVPAISAFAHQLNVTNDAMINPDFPKVNFNDWYTLEHGDTVPVLSIAKDQWPIMRWDFDQLSKAESDGAGLLELTTQSIYKGGEYNSSFGVDLGMEFGKVRVFEILGGDPDWDQETVNYHSIFADTISAEVVNGQMIFDTEVSCTQGDKNYITIPRPVMQRLLDGTTRGLVLKPLGLINASFYASEEASGTKSPKLYFNTKK